MAEKMKDIKRRIHSVSSIRQITNAMELVSTSKMRKTRMRLEATRPYYTTVINNIGELLSITKGINIPLTKIRDVKTKLYIIISSDRGLAGGFSSNIIKYASSVINKDTDLLLTIGSKAYEYFHKRGYKIKDKFLDITEDFNFSNSKIISDFVLKMYENSEIDSLSIIFTKFKSALSQVPAEIQLLPAVDLFKNNSDKSKLEVITFEPSPEEMLDFLIREYVNIAIYGAMIESSASEQAARMQSMKNATESADDMIDELSLHYNRARQASITQELTEIVSGADALN